MQDVAPGVVDATLQSFWESIQPQPFWGGVGNLMRASLPRPGLQLDAHSFPCLHIGGTTRSSCPCDNTCLQDLLFKGRGQSAQAGPTNCMFEHANPFTCMCGLAFHAFCCTALCTCVNRLRLLAAPLRCTCSARPSKHTNFAFTNFYHRV